MYISKVGIRTSITGREHSVEVKKQKLSLVTTLDSNSKPNGSTSGTLPNQFSAYNHKKMQGF